MSEDPYVRAKRFKMRRLGFLGRLFERKLVIYPLLVVLTGLVVPSYGAEAYNQVVRPGAVAAFDRINASTDAELDRIQAEHDNGQLDDSEYFTRVSAVIEQVLAVYAETRWPTDAVPVAAEYMAIRGQLADCIATLAQRPDDELQFMRCRALNGESGTLWQVLDGLLR